MEGISSAAYGATAIEDHEPVCCAIAADNGPVHLTRGGCGPYLGNSQLHAGLCCGTPSESNGRLRESVVSIRDRPNVDTLHRRNVPDAVCRRAERGTLIEEINGPRVRKPRRSGDRAVDVALRQWLGERPEGLLAIRPGARRTCTVQIPSTDEKGSGLAPVAGAEEVIPAVYGSEREARGAEEER